MKKVNIFLSYSHEDSQEFVEVRKVLRSIKNYVGIDVWDDQRIKVGDKWRVEIEKALNNTNIGILLVSTSFLNSQFIADVELSKLLSQYKNNRQTRVFIVVLRQCAWKQIPWLNEFQLFNNGLPLWGENVTKAKREGYLVKLVNELVEMAKTIRDSSKRIYKPKQGNKNPEQDDSNLPFTNQEALREILKPPQKNNVEQTTFTYVALTGHAGQGKSRLLCKLKDMYIEEGWNCGYATLDPDMGEKILVRDLLKDLGISFKNIRSNKNLGKEFYRQYTEKKRERKKPLALFIDTLGSVTRNDIWILDNNFVEDLDKYITTNEHLSNPGMYRLILAGRNLSSDLIESPHPEKYTDFKLSSFQYKDVYKMVVDHKIFSDLKLETKADFAADILYLSGGHPGLMARIVERYKEEKLNHQDFIDDYIRNYWVNDLAKTMNQITSGIFDKKKKIREFAEATVVFRYFNKSLIKKMFKGQAVEKIVSEVINFSGLYRESDNPEYSNLFSDGTIRDIHALHLLANNPEIIKSKCVEAQNLCWDEIVSGIKVKEFMIEYIFQCLQEVIADSKNKIHSQRKIIRRNFEKRIEEFVIKLAKIHRDKIRKEELGDEFIAALKRQADTKDSDKNKALFHFWVIYIYKDKSYNKDIYNNFISYTEKLVDKHLGRRKK